MALEPQEAERQLAVLIAAGTNPSQLGGLAGDLFARGRFELALMIFAAWSEWQPQQPEPWSNLGLCLAKLQQAENARQVLEYALSLDERFAPARNNLCAVYQHLGLHPQQLDNARIAVELQPGSALALNNLGAALLDSGMSTEAKLAFEESLQITPDNFEAGFNLARIAIDDGRYGEAMSFLETARSGPAAYASDYREMIEYHLAYAYLANGRLSEGWDLYERGFSPLISPTIARLPDRRFLAPQWNGSPLAKGQRLMLWREQGIGDELRFLSLLPQADLGQGQIIIETDPRLVSILQRGFPHAEVRTQQIGGEGREDFDVQLPIGSLPRLFMKESRPRSGAGIYLQPTPFEVNRFAQRLPSDTKGKKIGICWRSHQLGGARNRKYTALTDWYRLLSARDCIFVSLQYGDCEQELRDAELALGIKIFRWQDVNLRDDLDAVLGLLHNLDGVISPATAVVPMAGAVGKSTLLLTNPTWLLLGERECYPWFDTVKPLVVEEGGRVADCLPRAAELIDQMF